MLMFTPLNGRLDAAASRWSGKLETIDFDMSCERASSPASREVDADVV